MSRKLKLLADQLRVSIMERNRLLAMQVETVQDDEDEMRHSLRTLHQGIKSLDGNGTAYTADALQDDIGFLKKEYKELYDLYGEQDPELQGFPTQELSYTDDPEYARQILLPERLRKSVRFSDSVADQNINNGEVLQMQTQIMREQDSSLDNLSVSISRQRELSAQIGNELDEHGELLDTVSSMADRSTNKLEQAKHRLTSFSRKARENGHLFSIIILIIILFLLLSIG